jgi:flagellar protein FlaG
MQILAAGRGMSGTLFQELPQEGRRLFQAEQILERTLPGRVSLPGSRTQESKVPGNIRAMSADLEKVSRTFNRRLKFIVNHQTHEVTVNVIDGETNKVIKVLPPEELQRLHSRIKETIGFLFDEEV